MALIEIYHVVADQIAIDQNTTEDIVEGRCVNVGNDGNVDLAGADELVYGIAGDTRADGTAGTPYADDIIMGARGGLSRSTQNRVSDFFNETGASGFMTVYTSGGKFATDQFEGSREDNLVPGTVLYSSANGRLTDLGANNPVGSVVSAPANYPSGVPGTDTGTDGSISLGTYVIFKLLV